MPTKRESGARQRGAGDPASAAERDEAIARIYALMGEADELYKRRRYRQAIAACRKLARLDPSNAMPAEMIEGCQRRLRVRRTILAAALAVVVIAALGTALVSTRILRIYAVPPPGTLRLRERATQAFEFHSLLRLHTGLEYTWELRDGEGNPVPPAEQGTLAQRRTVPWACSYTPPYSLVRAASGGQPVVRRLVASGVNASGSEVTRAEWRIEVANTPIPPTILSASPRTDRVFCIVAGEGEATLRVEAADGDGGADLTYEWLVGGESAHKGTEPAWAYRPPADALPPGKTGREKSFEPPVALTCRVANRFGEPLATSVGWTTRLVRSNAPPQLVAFEPPVSDVVRIAEDEKLAITVRIFDPDEAETIRYAWELDGAAVSHTDTCTLQFPRGTTDSEKRYTLRLTVTDCCGAQAARAWQVVVVAAPRPAGPSPF